jgi:hypothetical protein
MKVKKKNLIFEQRIKSNMVVPNEVKQLHSLFTKNGFVLYIVGGAVRDTLLNKQIKDYDLATDAPPEAMVKMFNSKGIKNVPVEVGGKQAVVNIHMKDDYEIATFRADSKAGDGRRPDTVTFSTIENDAKRRDLTINALYFDMATNEIIDLVGGIEDIKNGVVRTVGEASDRFEEDELRIMRAIRFAARIGSNLDSGIDKALRQNNSMEKIAGERIMIEFTKGIQSAKSTKHFLSLIDKYGLFDWVFRGMSPINKNFIESNNETVVIAGLLKEIPHKLIGKALNKLKYGNNLINDVSFLVRFDQEMSVENFYDLKTKFEGNHINGDFLKEFAGFLGMNMDIVNRFVEFKLSVDGDDIMNKYKIKPGREVYEIKKKLETELFLSK